MRAVGLGFAIAVGLAGCTVQRDYAPPDAPGTDGYPPPRTDLVPPIGSATTLEIATWNIENFPDTSLTASYVADVIASLDLDIVVVEEIASETAWAELLERLPEHDGALSTHTYSPTEYQKIGIVYRSSLVTVGAPTLLFTNDAYAFPRPPFSIPVTVDGDTFEVIGVHLKAGGALEDAQRRTLAVAALDQHLRDQIDSGGESEVIVLGDYNERVTTDDSRAVLAPLLTAPDRYNVRTEPSALAGGVTYLGFGGTWIDHITTTSGLASWFGAARVVVPRLDAMIPGYRSTISDHLPVVMVVDLPPVR